MQLWEGEGDTLYLWRLSEADQGGEIQFNTYHPLNLHHHGVIFFDLSLANGIGLLVGVHFLVGHGMVALLAIRVREGVLLGTTPGSSNTVTKCFPLS